MYFFCALLYSLEEAAAHSVHKYLIKKKREAEIYNIPTYN
jgi:hypothetical protein